MGRKHGSFTRRFGAEIPVIGGRPVDFCAVYVVGPKDESPVKIGYGKNPVDRLSGIQTGNWIELILHYTVWAVDNMLARRIELACHRLLDQANKRISGEWFGVPVEWAKRVIAVAAHKEGIPLYSNRDLNQLTVTREDLRMADLMRVSNVFCARTT